ncbi:hypothetical protein Dda_0247 [Drechslerella dactyloides]|uniref:Metallo-beta-lactamase domain-containing protein n=1 Tax=Drechslerella dactyloides TaxID=74499 RepID=A0AAD6J697_DREDA|nr:hypothetical protein Dda_0247 [Drechslerella dactyloides]
MFGSGDHEHWCGHCSRRHKSSIRVETHINQGPALDVVSSLILGSKAAVLVDVPLTIPQARELIEWVKKTSQVPLVAIFATHFHPDHYMSASVVLQAFPTAKFYANSKAVALIKNEAQKRADFWRSVLPADSIVETPAIPTPYDYSFFSLPCDGPIFLISSLNGDTPDETMFWVPNTRTLIAGDVVYGHKMHMWLADLDEPSLTTAWLESLDLISSLGAQVIIPGHALINDQFDATKDLEHTRAYLQFFRDEVESKGVDALTPDDIAQKLTKAFPGLLEVSGSTTSKAMVQINSQHFGKGGSRQPHFVDLADYQKAIATKWSLA